MSVPVSLMTASAVVTSIPSIRVNSTPHILKSWVRKSNFGALRERPRCSAFGRFTVVRLQALELLLNVAVALAQLRADEVERSQRLLEREQVFGAPVSL